MKMIPLFLTLLAVTLVGCFEHQEAPHRLVKAENLSAISQQTEALILTNSPAVKLPTDLAQKAPALRELHLRASAVNDLSVLPNLKALELLDLTATEARRFLPLVQQVPSLTTLYLGSNQLESLPDLSPLACLTYLNLDRNALTTLPKLPATLRWLRLNENKLTSLPEGLQLPNLERIYLSGNQLTTVPAQLKQSPKLTDIDLSGNPITEFPEWLAGISTLKNLSLRRSKIRKLPTDLRGLKSLSVLDLSYCPLDDAERNRIREAFSVYRTHIIF